MQKLSLCALTAALLLTASASAAERAYPAERLEPAFTTEGIGNTEWAGVPAHLAWDAALWVGYENDPLFTLTTTDGLSPVQREGVLVENRLHANVTGAIALFDFLQLGVDIPVLLLQGRDDLRAPEVDRSAPLGTTGLGDMRLAAKFGVLKAGKTLPFDLAFMLPVGLPTGQLTDFFGSKSLSITPMVLLSRDLGAVRLAGNLGYRFQGESEFLDLDVGNELIYRAAISYRFDVVKDRPTEVGLSLAGAAASSGDIQRAQQQLRTPTELLVDVQHTVFGPLDVFFGGGAGLRAGNGVPDYRIFAGVRVSDRAPRDTDGDGLVGDADKCPDEPESKNGFMDEDGCPDADADNDGIADAADGCPSVAEDKDNIEDADGCPEDDDKDGVADADDACRTEAEDKDSFKDADGCPDPDNDDDGILDGADKCPGDAEDKDGFEDTDGCPDADNDKDGIPDIADACPLEAGIKANRGCADTDKDGDTVVDRLDNCPDEKGTVENGGCATKQLVVLTESKLEIKDKVFFKTGSDVIDKKSFALLNNVAAVLNAHPELLKIRIEGHTDNVGVPEKNKDLSQRRADSVRKYLVSKAVAEARLESVGYGQDKPIATNDTDDGKAQNRRVEFFIAD